MDAGVRSAQRRQGRDLLGAGEVRRAGRSGSGAWVSASIPSVASSPPRATAQPRYPSQWVIAADDSAGPERLAALAGTRTGPGALSQRRQGSVRAAPAAGELGAVASGPPGATIASSCGKRSTGRRVVARLGHGHGGGQDRLDHDGSASTAPRIRRRPSFAPQVRLLHSRG